MAPASGSGGDPVRTDRPPAWRLLVEQDPTGLTDPRHADRRATPSTRPDGDETPAVLRPADPWRHRD